MEHPEYAGLLALTLRRVKGTARAAGVVWFAVFALPVVRLRKDGGGGIGLWAPAVIAPAVIALALMFFLHWVPTGFRLRPHRALGLRAASP